MHSALFNPFLLGENKIEPVVFEGGEISVTVLLCFQLVLTVGLLAVVVYLYTVVAFNFFRKFYNKSEDEDEPDMKCDDMMTVSRAPLALAEKGHTSDSVEFFFLF